MGKHGSRACVGDAIDIVAFRFGGGEGRKGGSRRRVAMLLAMSKELSGDEGAHEP